jgi:hypothetical protein
MDFDAFYSALAEVSEKKYANTTAKARGNQDPKKVSCYQCFVYTAARKVHPLSTCTVRAPPPPPPLSPSLPLSLTLLSLSLSQLPLVFPRRALVIAPVSTPCLLTRCSPLH